MNCTYNEIKSPEAKNKIPKKNETKNHRDPYQSSLRSSTFLCRETIVRQFMFSPEKSFITLISIGKTELLGNLKLKSLNLTVAQVFCTISSRLIGELNLPSF